MSIREPNLSENLILASTAIEAMILNNDIQNLSMVTAVRQLLIDAQHQADTLMRLHSELRTAINRPSWSFAFRNDVRKPNEVLTEIENFLSLLNYRPTEKQ